MTTQATEATAPEPLSEPVRDQRSTKAAVPAADAFDELLGAWNRWQNLRATDAPAWARMAAFEAYVGARARLRTDFWPAAGPHRAGDASGGGLPGPSSALPRRVQHHAHWVRPAVVLGVVVAALLVAVVLAAGTARLPEVGPGSNEPGAGQPVERGGSDRPTREFSPGL